jgi:hypothetical protein
VEVEEFFSTFIGRGRVREAINALLAAREFQFTHVGTRSMLHIPPPKPTMATPRRLVRPGQPIARRPRRGSAPRPLAPVPAGTKTAETKEQGQQKLQKPAETDVVASQVIAEKHRREPGAPGASDSSTLGNPAEGTANPQDSEKA